MVIDDAGRRQAVSMLDLYKNAHNYKALTGELPTQDIAILRMLLAVIYAVFIKIDATGRCVAPDKVPDMFQLWKSLWGRGNFQYEKIEQYLKFYEDRFFLFHPETPFFQVAGLRTKDGDTNPVTQIIADVPSRAVKRFFSNRLGREVGQLNFDEAARWLINLHAWDYAGKKASTVGGDPNGGGTGWLGKLGVVYLTGNSVFETLLLNMVLVDDNTIIPLGSPCWAYDSKTPAKANVRPRGFVDLLTWQSRRVLLFENEGVVDGVLSSYGDVFDKENTFEEQMSGWHISSEPSLKDKYIPNTLNRERSIWRDLSSLLPFTSENIANIQPGVVRWRGSLQAENAVDVDAVNIAVVGIEWGKNMGVIDELITDRLTFNANLLTDLGQHWLPHILDALQSTDACIRVLGDLARDLAKSAGAYSEDKKLMEAAGNAIKEEAYSFFDLPFRNWLASISSICDDRDKRCAEWKAFVRDSILRMGTKLVSECADAALVGRDSNLNGPNVFSLFKSKVFKEIPTQTLEGGQDG